MDGCFTSLNANSGGGQNRAGVCYPINEQIATRWQALGERTGLGVGKDDDPAFTLQAAHPHMVCYALDSTSSNSMKSANPHSGFHEEQVTKTLQAGGVDPTCNRGGNVIVEPVASFMSDQGEKAETGSSPTAIPVTLEPGLATRKGGHIYEGVSGTICANPGSNRMAVAYSPSCLAVLNDQGGTRMDVSYDVTATLRAQEHGHQPCVILETGGFLDGNSAKARSIGHEEKRSPTLRESVTPSVVYALQGNSIDRADTAGCNGRGWHEDVCYTLNTIDRPAICCPAETLAVDGYNQNASAKMGSLRAGKSDGDHVGIVCYPEKERTLTAVHGSPCTDKGENVVVYEPKSAMDENWAESSVKNALRANSSKSSHVVCYDARGNGDGECVPTLTGDHENRVTDYTSVCIMAHGQSNAEISQDMSPTLNCNHEQPIAAYGVDCRNAVLDEEKTHTIQAKASGGQSLNCTPSVLTDAEPPRRYIVRRLTPLECCRLQGFPDGWGDTAKKDGMTDEEYRFWLKVRQEKEKAGGRISKDYTQQQILNWYNKLHTDSAEYKMWGNGIALPCAAFVLGGVIEAIKNTR